MEIYNFSYIYRLGDTWVNSGNQDLHSISFLFTTDYCLIIYVNPRKGVK